MTASSPTSARSESFSLSLLPFGLADSSVRTRPTFRQSTVIGINDSAREKSRCCLRAVRRAKSYARGGISGRNSDYVVLELSGRQVDKPRCDCSPIGRCENWVNRGRAPESIKFNYSAVKTTNPKLSDVPSARSLSNFAAREHPYYHRTNIYIYIFSPFFTQFITRVSFVGEINFTFPTEIKSSRIFASRFSIVPSLSIDLTN